MFAFVHRTCRSSLLSFESPALRQLFSSTSSVCTPPEDSEARAERLARKNAGRRQRYNSDPRLHEYGSEWWKKRIEDPEFYRKSNERSVAYRKKKLESDTAFRQNHHIRRWLYCMSESTFDEVKWSSHKPVFYSENTFHQCATCQRPRYGGRKLWWKRLNRDNESAEHDGSREETERGLAKFDCHPCFSARWPEVGMPWNYHYVKDKNGTNRMTRIKCF